MRANGDEILSVLFTLGRQDKQAEFIRKALRVYTRDAGGDSVDFFLSPFPQRKGQTGFLHSAEKRVMRRNSPEAERRQQFFPF